MMIQVPRVSRAPAVSMGSESRLRAPIDANPVRRKEWVTICAARLSQLRPHHDREFSAAVARDLWSDVGSFEFDPVISAEMEYEAWRLDD